ncbi:MAG: 3D domain-containing protein [Deltaproteobacteria bacterium]|nr:3D domain-containing protein [Deltaproteobacteria bacterium]
MTRINLLVAKVVLLGICILCIFSGSVWAEEIKISLTAYTLKECYHNKGQTASGEQSRAGIVAVSPDLERKGLKLGTKIKINDLGTFVVKDRTSRRNRGNVDIFMKSYTKALQFGRQKSILVLNRFDLIPVKFATGDFFDGIVAEIKPQKELFWAQANTNRNVEIFHGKRHVSTLD